MAKPTENPLKISTGNISYFPILPQLPNLRHDVATTKGHANIAYILDVNKEVMITGIVRKTPYAIRTYCSFLNHFINFESTPYPIVRIAPYKNAGKASRKVSG